MNKRMIGIMAMLFVFWAVLIALGVLYGLIAPTLALVGMCATAGAIVLMGGNGDD